MRRKERVPSRQAAPSSNGSHLDDNGFERGCVTEIQRARMLVAMTEVAAELGAANVTVADVVGRSGVSRRTFYEIFRDRDDCLLAAVDEGIARARRRVLAGDDPRARWRERIRASLAEFLGLLDEQPALGRLLIVETLAAGPRVLERRSRVVAHVAEAVDQGRQEGKGAPVTPLAAEGIVGAILSVIHDRMSQGVQAPLVELLNQLMSMIVLPYLGVAAARRELERPAMSHRAPVEGARPDSLAVPHMRVTYRTMRVLDAIASKPGSSNRRVGDMAGIADPGQVSKLLHRLHQLGLIDNAGTAASRGEPNAWRLTPKGQEVERAIGAGTHQAQASAKATV